MAANLKSASIVDALATVPRERFLPAGPWIVKSEADVQGPPRQTPDADPRHVYHNIGIAIDPARTLFNGAPGLLSMAIDALAPAAGARVLHVGTGLGYYTAILAHCVGPTGRVLGIEVDPDLAEAARANLASYPWAEIRHDNGVREFGQEEMFDAVLINAGVTHPQPAWLDAIAPGGRMALPLTVGMPAMGPIGKGPLVLMSRGADPSVFSARMLTFVAIYSGVGLRDAAIEPALGAALSKNPFPPLKSFRRDAHGPGPACWLHTDHGCLST
ncbi:MAG TPA: methyltransferase domain-containing protein [Vicinamibacterales bacterium]|nr:methyltransferase domain-containing protein [Vicinamibacterales bacterium]